PPRALRFYEERGLLPPPARSTTAHPFDEGCGPAPFPL
ncbi:MerR family DNA-binding transcriptional regulator, partial [Streptomyces sp. NPDC048430]